MTIPELKKSLQNNDYKKVYLFKGEETYLVHSYIKRLKDALPEEMSELNLSEYEGETDLMTASEAIQTFPVMSEHRLIIFKDSTILCKHEPAKENMINSIPEYAVVVFVESPGQKLSKKMENIVDANGAVVNFAFQNPSDIRAWVNIMLRNAGKRMSNSSVERMIQLCDLSMGKLELEVNKLIAYAGDREEITDKDINDMVTPNIEFKVYELVDYLLNKRFNQAYELLAEFKQDKDTQPTAVLSSIFEQIHFIAMVKNLREDSERIDEFFPPKRAFLAKRIVKTVMNYEKAFLYRVMNNCAEYNYRIKNGLIDGWTAVELVMADIINK